MADNTQSAKRIAEAIETAANAISLGQSVIVRGSDILFGDPTVTNTFKFKENDPANIRIHKDDIETAVNNVISYDAVSATTLAGKDVLNHPQWGILTNANVYNDPTNYSTTLTGGGKKKGKANKSKAKKGKKGGTRRRKR